MRKATLLWAVLCTIGALGVLCRAALTGETPGQAPGPEQKPEAQAQAETKKLLPQPTLEAIKQAEKMVNEVFGRDVAKAKTTSEKAKLAQEILKTAREEKDPASRWVLAQRAKQLAVQAQDAKLAVQAAEVLAAFEPAGGPISAKEAADRAHGLWAKGELAKGPERLARRIDAAELYLRALDDLEGFEKSIAERRLKELGWSKYVFAFEFEKDTEGWTFSPTAIVTIGNHISEMSVQNGILIGKIIGGDPYIVRNNLQFDGLAGDVLEIRMAVTGASFAQFFWITQDSPRWSGNQHISWKIHGDGQLHTYQLPIGKLWHGKTIIGLRIDPGGWDRNVPRNETFSIDYVRLRRSNSLSNASHFSSGQE